VLREGASRPRAAPPHGALSQSTGRRSFADAKADTVADSTWEAPLQIYWTSHRGRRCGFGGLTPVSPGFILEGGGQVEFEGNTSAERGSSMMDFFYYGLIEPFFLTWLGERRSVVAFGAAAVLFLAALVLWYVYEVWWPWGIVMATFCALIALLGINEE